MELGLRDEFHPGDFCLKLGSQFRQEPKANVPRGGHILGACRVPLTSSSLSARQSGLSFKCHTAESWLIFRIWMEMEAFFPRRSRPN